METIKFKKLKGGSLFEFNRRTYVKIGRTKARQVDYNPPEAPLSGYVIFVNEFYFNKNELVKSNHWNIKKWWQFWINFL